MVFPLTTHQSICVNIRYFTFVVHLCEPEFTAFLSNPMSDRSKHPFLNQSMSCHPESKEVI